MRDRKGVNPDVRGSEEELEGIDKGEIIIRIYYLKINLFLI